MSELQSFTIKDFNGGISDLSNKGVRGSFRFGHGIDLRNTSSSLSCNQRLIKNSGTIVTDLLRFGVPATDGSWYGFGDTGKIVKRTSGGGWSEVYDDPDGAIMGAVEFIHNDGNDNYVSHLVWATQTKLKRIVLSAGFGSPETITTFEKGIAGEFHVMKTALGVVFVCDADYLLLLDYEGATNKKSLQFPGGIYSKDILENNNIIVIGASEVAQQKQGYVFTWDKLQDSWINKKNLQAQGLNSMNFLESGLLLQSGEELKYWDTANLVPLKQLPGGGTTLPGAQTEYRSIAMFGVYGGTKNGVFGYGRRDKNSPFAMNLEYVPSYGRYDNANDVIGSVSNHQGEMLVSWYDSVAQSYGVDIIDADNKAPALYQSLEIDAGTPYASKVWPQIKVVTRPLPAGTSLSLRARTINDDDWQTCKMDNQETSMATAGQKVGIFNIAGARQGEIVEIEVSLTPSANLSPEVISLNIFNSILTLY